MDKRFVPSSYEQELYLEISSFSQQNLMAEEYFRDFEQLQMRVDLHEEPKLKITRFTKVLPLNGANGIDFGLIVPLMMCPILPSKLRSNVRSEVLSYLPY